MDELWLELGELSELIRVAILLIIFGILLPTFDNYSDLIFSHSLLTGNYEAWGTPKPQPIYGSVMLIPILVTTLFVIPHWLKREDSIKKRLLTFPLLLGMVISVVKFSRVGYKIRKIFGQILKYSKENMVILKHSFSEIMPNI